jgi:hypothetical protein
MRLLIYVAASIACAATGVAEAALIVNAARPITERVNVNLIAVADDDGTDSTAGMFGTATQQASVFSLVDDIYAQAGVDVEFSFRPGTFKSSFTRTGTPGNNSPRPTGDLSTIRSRAAAAGNVLSGDSNVLNVFLVSIVPGFSQLSANSSAGLAYVGSNGITYYGGGSLLGFASGREVLASVLAHEIGHNLGLDHNSVNENLMGSNGASDGERLTTAQIQTILASGFTTPWTPPLVGGDFDDDGVVSGGDFLAWQRGESPSRLGSGDLASWRANFGGAAAGAMAQATAATVPEPGTPVLAVVLGLGVITIRPRCRRRRG